MFDVGDIVEIKLHEGYAMPESPVVNLEGSIVRINYKTVSRGENVYHFEILEPHIKNMAKHYYDDGELNWKDHHFKLVEKTSKIQEVDTSSLFTDD